MFNISVTDVLFYFYMKGFFISSNNSFSKILFQQDIYHMDVLLYNRD